MNDEHIGSFADPSVFERGLGVETIDLDDQCVLLDRLRGTRLRLNATGADVWRLLDERRTFGELVAITAGKWDVAEQVSRKSLQQFISTMIDLGAVGGNAVRVTEGTEQ